MLFRLLVVSLGLAGSSAYSITSTPVKHARVSHKIIGRPAMSLDKSALLHGTCAHDGQRVAFEGRVLRKLRCAPVINAALRATPRPASHGS